MAKKVTSAKTAKNQAKKAVESSAKSAGSKVGGTSEETYRRRLRDIIRAQARDPEPLALTVEMAASALHWWSTVRYQIGQLKSYTVVDVSKYGEKIKKHPLFEVATMAMDEARANLKILGLTFEDVINRDRDEMDEFDKKINGE